MTFDDILANGKTDTGPGVIRLRMQPLEDDEDLLMIFRIDPDTVILYGECPMGLFLTDAHGDNRCPSIPEFDGIADEILEQLQEQFSMTDDRRKRFAIDDRSRFLNAHLQIHPNIFHYLIAIHMMER